MAQSRLSLLFFASLAVAFLMAGPALAEAVLSQVSGDVEIGRGEPAKWSRAQSGDVVAASDRVRTGADGRVEITMDAGTLRVHENSMLRLPPAVPDADRVDLEAGRSLFDVLRRGDRRFEVHTPTVVVSVKGTRFGVDAGTEIGEVTVYRGTVGVRQAGASDMMETLVREGFLATGGGGMAIELDVSTTPDPWQAWQHFDRVQVEDHKTPTRLGEMERAKATLHRATTADVIVQAAERRPEVAKRLEALQRKQRNEAGGEAGQDGKSGKWSGPLPAAPDPGSDRTVEMEREILKERLSSETGDLGAEEMQREALEVDQVFDAERVEQELDLERKLNLLDLSGGGSGTIELDYKALYELSPEALVIVSSTLVELNSELNAGTYTPTSPSDLATELESALIDEGFTDLDATKAVRTLLGM
jgi:hypothetical protein